MAANSTIVGPQPLTQFQQFLDGPQFPDITGVANSADDFALVKFGNLFGTAAGQAPTDVPVAKAWLAIATGDLSNNLAVERRVVCSPDAKKLGRNKPALEFRQRAGTPGIRRRRRGGSRYPDWHYLTEVKFCSMSRAMWRDCETERWIMDWQFSRRLPQMAGRSI